MRRFPPVCSSVQDGYLVRHTNHGGFVSCSYRLHSKENSCPQMSIVQLPWQVGLIANVKLHFFLLTHILLFHSRLHLAHSATYPTVSKNKEQMGS